MVTTRRAVQSEASSRAAPAVAPDLRRNPADLPAYLHAKAAAVQDPRAAEATRLSILANAAQLLNQARFDGLRVPDICKLCDISRATFYLHFSGWEPLFHELIDQVTRLESERSPPLDGRPPIEQAVARIVEWYFEGQSANAWLFTNLTFLCRGNPKLATAWHLRSLRLHELVSATLLVYPEFRALDQGRAHLVLETFGVAMNTLALVGDDVARLGVPSLYTREALLKSLIDIQLRAMFGRLPWETPQSKARSQR